MDDTALDTLLTRSAPPTPTAHPAVDAGVHAMIREADVAARPARRVRRALWIAAIPAVPALALGLTAGIDDRLAPDLIIPISYTTDTGVQINCSVFRFNGEIGYVETSFAGVDYLRAQDWTGIGQRIYAEALVQEATLRQQAAVDPAAVDLSVVERSAWSIAEDDLVDKTVPTKDGDHWGGDSDCTGQLH